VARACALLVLCCGAPLALAQQTEGHEGYAEYRRRDALVVDGQRVRVGVRTKFKGQGSATSFERIPLGYEVKLRGLRLSDGTLLASELEAKPNGSAFMEADMIKAFDETEAQYRKSGSVFEEDENGRRVTLGELEEDGPRVERVREIMRLLVPPYLRAEDFRVYVVRNKEWNAMAAPNRSIYVFSGLLDAMDDDEVAVVLGHELAHATHEHSRRAYKKQIFVALGALAVGLAVESKVEDDNKRLGLQLGTLLVASAMSSGYGRGYEDQADRVGLRYAYEGGYAVEKGPGLWDKFAKKYGDTNKAVNFFFGDHSVAKDRARNLRQEIAWNYQ
jgi:Zn-dependent protease with chaperone function